EGAPRGANTLQIGALGGNRPRLACIRQVPTHPRAASTECGRHSLQLPQTFSSRPKVGTGTAVSCSSCSTSLIASDGAWAGLGEPLLTVERTRFHREVSSLSCPAPLG